MICMNPNVDVFIFSDNQIQVRKLDFEESLVEILEISGEDASDFSRIIPWIWREGITNQQFFDFFGGKYSESQIVEAVASLESAGIVSRENVFGESFVSSFRLNQITDNLFFFRIDCSAFLIQAKNEIGARAMFRKIARRWGSESDLEIFRNLLNNSFLSLPAKITGRISRGAMESLPQFTRNGSVIELRLVHKGDELFIERYDSFKEAREVITDPNSYWGGFILQAIDKAGLIASVQRMNVEIEPFPLSKKFFLAAHVLTDFDGKPVNDSQVGLGETHEEACGKAVMEALERYCCEKRPTSLIETRALDLVDGEFISPNRLACYFAGQLVQAQDLKNFQEKEKYLWTEIYEVNGTSCLIPACHIWYCFRRSDFVDGKSLFWASTGGAAAHFSFERAAFSAVRELIERDAVMIWWLNRLSPPIAKCSFLDKGQKEIIKKIEYCGFEVKLLNLTLDLFPVVMAVARDKNGKGPYFFCGAACHEDFSLACDKALLELEQAVWSRLNQDVVSLEPEDVCSPLDHEMFYLSPENGMKLDFLFEGQEQEVLIELVHLESLQDLATYLENNGFQLFLKDITCDEIKEAELDIHVVKAVMPDLVPITFGFMAEPLGLQRIFNLPLMLGLRQKPLSGSDLLRNYQPHFFS